MILYGSPICPFTRRVLILASELGAEVTLMDVRTPEGAEELSHLHPLSRAPVADFGGVVIYGDRAIQTELLMEHGRPLATDGRPRLRKVDRHFWEDGNLVDVIDGVARAILEGHRLRREGFSPRSTLLRDLQADGERGLAWLSDRLEGPCFQTPSQPGFGLAEIAFLATVDTLGRRSLLMVPEDGKIAAFLAFHSWRPSISGTRA